jgi:hypothetical protein
MSRCRRSSLAVGSLLWIAVPSACGGTDPGNSETAGPDTDADSDGDTASDGSSGGDDGTATGDGDTSTGDGDGDTSTGDGDGTGPSPTLPVPTGSCPTLSPGTVTFAPTGIDARGVRVWISDAANSLDGPLVFYWHGTGSSPTEASFGLSQAVIDDILAQGGVVVAPTSAPDAGQFPWFVVNGSARTDDFILAAEIVGCVEQSVGIDDRRIHTTGMSAGGLQTTQMAHRAAYIASAASYSGGVFTPATSTDPSNKFAAMVIHGGAGDEYGGFVNFQQTSQSWHSQLVGAGHFAFLCDHGGGHTIPPGMGDDIAAFFAAHPYGTEPSPWVGGLPGGFHAACGL